MILTTKAFQRNGNRAVVEAHGREGRLAPRSCRRTEQLLGKAPSDYLFVSDRNLRLVANRS